MKQYKLTNLTLSEEVENREKNNLIILSISQSNWWAIYAHIIKFGAYLDNLPPFSHSAFCYWRNGQYMIDEFQGHGYRTITYNQRFKGFKGYVAGNVSTFRATPINMDKIRYRYSGYTYNVPLAIRSELQFFPASNDGDDTYCTAMVAGGIETLSNQDTFPGDNNKYTPSKLYSYTNNKIKYPVWSKSKIFI